mgnify:CR=1 FL=1
MYLTEDIMILCLIFGVIYIPLIYFKNKLYDFILSFVSGRLVHEINGNRSKASTLVKKPSRPLTSQQKREI